MTSEIRKLSQSSAARPCIAFLTFGSALAALRPRARPPAQVSRAGRDPGGSTELAARSKVPIASRRRRPKTLPGSRPGREAWRGGDGGRLEHSRCTILGRSRPLWPSSCRARAAPSSNVGRGSRSGGPAAVHYVSATSLIRRWRRCGRHRGWRQSPAAGPRPRRWRKTATRDNNHRPDNIASTAVPSS